MKVNISNETNIKENMDTFNGTEGAKSLEVIFTKFRCSVKKLKTFKQKNINVQAKNLSVQA